MKIRGNYVIGPPMQTHYIEEIPHPISKPNPNGKEIGELIGILIPRYEAGDCYELVRKQADGVEVIYGFKPTSNHCLRLEYITFRGQEPSLVNTEPTTSPS